MTPAKVYSWLDRACGGLLPPRCVLCGGRGQRPSLDICSACEGDLPVHAVIDDLPSHDPTSGAVLAETQSTDPRPCDRLFAAFEYASPVDVLVHALKYRGQLATGRVLGVLLGDRIVRYRLHLDVDVVLPVPLHPARHAERGFNQSAELGRWVAREVGRRFREGAVIRVRHTGPQVGLRLDERRTNLAGAFSCTASLAGLRVAVVDDVLTTGSTARAIATALRQVGATSVDLWCVARALPPGQCGEPADRSNPVGT
jgi:ComF family protein